MVWNILCVHNNKIVNRIITEDNPTAEFLEQLRLQGFQQQDGTWVPYDFLRRGPGPNVPTPPSPQIGWLYDPNTNTFSPDPNPPPPEIPQEEYVRRHNVRLTRYQEFLEGVAQRLGIPPPSDDDT